MCRINFGQHLKLALKKAGKSQKWLAYTIDVPHQNVSRWVLKDDARLSTVCRICDALDISVAEFCALEVNNEA